MEHPAMKGWRNGLNYVLGLVLVGFDNTCTVSARTANLYTNLMANVVDVRTKLPCGH